MQHSCSVSASVQSSFASAAVCFALSPAVHGARLFLFMAGCSGGSGDSFKTACAAYGHCIKTRCCFLTLVIGTAVISVQSWGMSFTADAAELFNELWHGREWCEWFLDITPAHAALCHVLEAQAMAFTNAAPTVALAGTADAVQCLPQRAPRLQLRR